MHLEFLEARHKVCPGEEKQACLRAVFQRLPQRGLACRGVPKEVKMRGEMLPDFFKVRKQSSPPAKNSAAIWPLLSAGGAKDRGKSPLLRLLC
jgi:hypothetical protein